MTALSLGCVLFCACTNRAELTVQAAPTMALAAAASVQEAQVSLTPDTAIQAASPTAMPSPTPVRTDAPSPAPTPEHPAFSIAQNTESVLITPAPTPTPRPSQRPLKSMLPMPLLGPRYVQNALKAAGIPADASYTVEVTYNTGELFSCLVHIKGEAAKVEDLLPVTVALSTGTPCTLSDFFSSKDTGWKSLLPDIVTRLAHSEGLTLLCEVPPVTDDQPFYIEDGNIILVYRLYEIATYDAGAPRFMLPMQEIRGYLSGAYGIGG